MSIAVSARESDLESLREWLGSERFLRGGVTWAATTGSRPDAMGDLTQVIVAVSSSSVAVALARSLTVWIKQRRSDVTITVKGAEGRIVTVDAKSVEDAQGLLQQVLDSAVDAKSVE